MPINQAFIFIKPHVFAHVGVHDLIAEKLKTSGIRVIREGIVTAQRMAAEKLIDRHYAVNARVATCLDPALLHVDATAQATFATRFGCSWSDACAAGRLYSADAMQHHLGDITGEQLAARWSASEVHKVAGGLYVAHFLEPDCFVLNGFYPAIRDAFIAPGAAIRWQIVQFDADLLPWHRFRHGIIGITDPARADASSIRGMAAARADALGIAVSCRRNLIHASASPFEALIEQLSWIDGFSMQDDPLGVTLDAAGITPAQLLAWRDTNPWVNFEGKEGWLVELAEDRDTPAVAALLQTLHEKLPTNG